MSFSEKCSISSAKCQGVRGAFLTTQESLYWPGRVYRYHCNCSYCTLYNTCTALQSYVRIWRWRLTLLLLSHFQSFCNPNPARRNVQLSAPKADSEAQSLTDGVQLSEDVVMPWVEYSTYRLGKQQAYQPTLHALRVGYQCIDTAFIHAGKHT